MTTRRRDSELTVSPYLLQPCRTYDEYLQDRERAEREWKAAEMGSAAANASGVVHLSARLEN